MQTARYPKRFYRSFDNTERWKTFQVKKDTSDLYIRAARDLSTEAAGILKEARSCIEEYIYSNNDFLHSLHPVAASKDAPEIVREMTEAGILAETGPMAAVAGAVAENVGRHLLQFSDEVIVENGGDIWLKTIEAVTLKVFAGNVFFKDGIAIRIQAADTPCGICTSSGKLGHSLSFGKADTVTVIAESAALADTVATAAANRVKEADSIQTSIDYAASINGVTGILIIYRDSIGAWGNIELCDPEKI